jgi:hypothetical protein
MFVASSSSIQVTMLNHYVGMLDADAKEYNDPTVSSEGTSLLQPYRSKPSSKRHTFSQNSLKPTQDHEAGVAFRAPAHPG